MSLEEGLSPHRSRQQTHACGREEAEPGPRGPGSVSPTEARCSGRPTPRSSGTPACPAGMGFHAPPPLTGVCQPDCSCTPLTIQAARGNCLARSLRYLGHRGITLPEAIKLREWGGGGQAVEPNDSSLWRVCHSG